MNTERPAAPITQYDIARDPTQQRPSGCPTHAGMLHSFITGTTLSGLAVAGGAILTLAAGMLFARWLNPEGFGIYSLALLVVSVGSAVGTGGMDATANRFACYYLGTGETRRVRSVISFSARWCVVTSTALGLAAFLFLRVGLLSRTPLVALISTAPYLGFAIAAAGLQQFLLQVILGLQAIKIRLILEKILQPLLRLLLPFALLWWTTDKTAVAVATLAVTAVLLTGASALVLRRRIRSLPSEPGYPDHERSQWRRYALASVTAGFQNLAFQGLGLDLILVTALTSLRDSGVYAAIFRLTPVLVMARVAMEYTFGPKVGVLYGASDFGQIGKLYKASSQLAFTWCAPWAISLMIFSAPVMTIFFGGSYGEGSSGLVIIVIGFAVDALTGCNSTLLSMSGRASLLTINGFSSGLVMTLLCFLLVPRFGTAGAAMAAAASRITSNGMATLEIWRCHRIHPFGPATLPMLTTAACAGAAGLAYAARIGAATLARPLPLCAGVFLIFATYGAILRLTGRQLNGELRSN